ncbi:MarR family winged helix-turn-helix transcriptional regulator [Sporosarcina sp. Te-1]|uniref:MarR family winged helix-turn-helix transcriptional regulator n=1 Tax=Sporosarcina sp. Te-1 TaxID=2818390 RepID=UPI001A9E63D0|nr:MarR family transcriptional regulator [Sporosarcina sp. Te-1]QTD39766.1 MarR family transcriptional regulator [Sporosarcina sp. Te-1]
MKEKLKEAIDLFEEVMIYGSEQVMKSVDIDIWKEYSPEQIQVLKILSTQGPLSNGKLAEIQGVHKSAVSIRLRRLEEKGLVTSSKNPTDQRTKVIELTPSGVEILRQSNEAVYESIVELFNGHINEEEIDTFVKTFRKLKDILHMRGM